MDLEILQNNIWLGAKRILVIDWAAMETENGGEGTNGVLPGWVGTNWRAESRVMDSYRHMDGIKYSLISVSTRKRGLFDER